MYKIEKNYANFIKDAKRVCKEVYDSYLLRYAYGIEASCYNYTPQVVINANNEKEIQKIFKLANKHKTSITFKAAGTSLSGQASCGGVLVIANSHFKDIKLNEDASIIDCDCGVIGEEANNALKGFDKKIGPDPATISSALIGGIFNNNSSGMCCGVEENSYHTVSSIRVILPCGSILDTSDALSIRRFLKTRGSLVESILKLREELLEDRKLCELIRHKFKIKNTTGYSINALLDFENIKDILNHLFIGSEGTLGFVSKVRYKSVKDYKFKGCALLFFKNLDETSKVVVKLASLGRDLVNAAEMMDYACLNAVKDYEGVPSIVKECQKDYTCILLQSVSDSKEGLDKNLQIIKENLKEYDMAFEPLFSVDEKEQINWWKIRKGLLPIVAGVRKKGSSVITEDICFHIEDFCDGAAFIKELFKEFGFDDNGVIFGHALSGNLHFIITPNLSDKTQYENFAKLVVKMSEKVSLMKGSIKAEHGTGKMVAPFVELEWGKKAYLLNVKIKELFDPNYLLNPDVIITKNKDIYKQNLKDMVEIENLPNIKEMINKCIECGFCEKHCPSREITLTPRQRISVLREVARLNNKSLHKEANKLLKEYEYFGVNTCAICSRCLELCPLNIDTAQIALDLRKSLNKDLEKNAIKLYENLDKKLILAKKGLKIYHQTSKIFNPKFISSLSLRVKKLNSKIPFIPVKMPLANNYELKSSFEFEEKIIYFSACTNRLFKPNLEFNKNKSLQEVFENLCKKAKISVLYPPNLPKLCCGKMFSNFDNLQESNINRLKNMLESLSENGKFSIVLDHSSCYYELLKKFEGSNLKVLDISEFLFQISSKLKIQKTDKKILVHKLCLLKKAKKDEFIEKLARMCSDEVELIKSFECCGFAGDKGFFVPELNQSSTKYLKDESLDFDLGVSSSATCEIGLNSYSKIEFVNIAFLLDSLSE
ncbi:FAD-binding oxidoreductase [Campylobacter sp. LR291e]|uniref:FAD-binding and (Fe-S)-binding domain-containing protein n=1 Tax=Campylobacter sp. LR291e TaxID=2593546 RepID=UPI0012395EC5|nr:FAD-binding and (Fe-S)-binding domain-containing protein [Campylobacter sp. LR291e]KAA6230878.1 FAD-binding oxidoreductase [Campylobacter sp. LR291e]